MKKRTGFRTPSRATARELREAVGTRRPRRVPVQVAVPEDTYARLVPIADAEGVAVGRVILRLAIEALASKAVSS